MKRLFFIEITFYLFWLSGKVHNSSSTSPPEANSRAAEVEHINCLQYNYQVHDALASMKPPFDNYFNISRAIFPSEDISSKLINICVHFTNSSVNLTQVDQRKYIWSRSCLYVSDRYLSLQAMRIYSMGAIWPDRRQEDLHITIPRFCNPKQTEAKLVEILSTLEDIAISPSNFNPSLNNAECVVEDDSKDRFESVKKIFPQMCWVYLLFSSIGGFFISMICIQPFNDTYNNNNDKTVVVKTTLFFLFLVFCLGVSFAITAIRYSAEGNQVVYPLAYLFFIALIFFHGIFCPNLKTDARVNRKTLYTLLPYTVDPGCFIVVHYLLWMIIGAITEPFWAIPIVTSCAAVIFLFYLSAFFCLSAERKWDRTDKLNLTMLVLAVLSTICVQFSFFVVGSHFFNEGLVSSIIPSVLVVILSIWCKLFRDFDTDDDTLAKKTREKNGGPSEAAERDSIYHDALP